MSLVKQNYPGRAPLAGATTLTESDQYSPQTALSNVQPWKPPLWAV